MTRVSDTAGIWNVLTLELDSRASVGIVATLVATGVALFTL